MIELTITLKNGDTFTRNVQSVDWNGWFLEFVTAEGFGTIRGEHIKKLIYEENNG